MLFCPRVIAVAVVAFSSLSFAHTDPTLPDGLTAADWQQVQSQILAHRFEAREQAAGHWQAQNSAHGFDIKYRSDGWTVLDITSNNNTSTSSIALQLEGYGYGEQLITLDDDPTLSSSGQTVTYQWKPGLREWWINSERGVAQWFELTERPPVAASDQPLVVALRLETDLNARIRNNALHLESIDGSTQITYDRLKVWDAIGRVLPAEMMLDGPQLALQVDDTNAVYPVTIDPTFTQTTYLKASNAGEEDFFGQSVAIDGDTLVVGATGEDSNATGVNGDQSDNSASSAGAAYVFVRSGTSWIQQAYLKASNAEQNDQFGSAVAISGDTIVIAARLEDSNATGVNGDQSDNSAQSSGAAYVFVRNGISWSQQSYLKASNTEATDQFGSDVAVFDDTIVVGALLEDSSATGVDGNQSDNSAQDAGAVYVFERTGTSWNQQTYLKASNAETDDFFGFSVALSGETLIVGAPSESSNAMGIDGSEGDNSAPDAGAAYVFVRNGSSWSQQVYLKASNTDAGDRFGDDVAASGDSVVVGALFEDGGATGVNGDQSDNSANNSGAAYVFVRNGVTWNQQAYLKASNTDEEDRFGDIVSVSDEIIAVGAAEEASNATGVDGDQSDNSADASGAVYIFMREATNWSQQAYLKSSNSETEDRFTAVTVSGNTILVGASGEDSAATGVDGDQTDNSAGDAGAAYVFELSSLPAESFPIPTLDMLGLLLLTMLSLLIGIIALHRP